MSSKILAKIHKQLVIRNNLNGIEFLLKKEGLPEKYIALLQEVVESYYVKDVKETAIVEIIDEEFYFEQIYLDIKKKNIIRAINILNEYNRLNRKYLDIVKDIVESAKTEEDYHI